MVVARIRLAVVAVVFLVSVGCGGAPVRGDGQAALATATLEVHVINVGQGHALFARGPDGTTLLVDGGRSSATGKLVSYLTGLGLPPGSTLDYVVLTHRDADHYAGITGLLESGYDVRRVIWDNGSSKTDTSVTRFLTAAAKTTAGPVQGIPVGTVIDLGGGATATCVAANGEVLGHGPVAGATNENDLSVALLIQHGDFDFIVAGDLGGGDDDAACTGRVHGSANVETPLARALTGGTTGLLGSDGVEVMMVNHHGSHSSTNSDYVNLLNPRVAIVGVGSNSYEHPRRVVVENTLTASVPCVTAPAALVLQTDEGDTRASADDVTFAGHVVGDVVLTTTGTDTFDVRATGDAAGPDERTKAGLPATFRLDEVPACKGNSDCDDGNPCTVDRCQAGVCSRTPAEAGTVCRAAVGACDVAEVCDGATPQCPADEAAADGTSCSDGDACNGSETCKAGTCTSGTGPSCDDNNPCTADSCDPQQGCVNTRVRRQCETTFCGATEAACSDPNVRPQNDPRTPPQTGPSSTALDLIPNHGKRVETSYRVGQLSSVAARRSSNCALKPSAMTPGSGIRPASERTPTTSSPA